MKASSLVGIQRAAGTTAAHLRRACLRCWRCSVRFAAQSGCRNFQKRQQPRCVRTRCSRWALRQLQGEAWCRAHSFASLG